MITIGIMMIIAVFPVRIETQQQQRLNIAIKIGHENNETSK